MTRLARRPHGPLMLVFVAAGAGVELLSVEAQLDIGTERSVRPSWRQVRVARDAGLIGMTTGERIIGIVVVEPCCVIPRHLSVAVGAGGRLEGACMRIVGLMTLQTLGSETEKGSIQGIMLTLPRPHLGVDDQRRLVTAAAIELAMSVDELEARFVVVEGEAVEAQNVEVETEVIFVAGRTLLFFKACVIARVVGDAPCQWLVAVEA